MVTFIFIYLFIVFVFVLFFLFVLFLFLLHLLGNGDAPASSFFFGGGVRHWKVGLVVKYHTGMIDYNTSNLVAGKSVTSKIQGRVAKSRRNF